uniref:Uncharacterized protein n=1 Tax=Anguilla anguilla TaxID=7936 RepID=A0A0E9S7T1_ANGAN
MTISAVYCARSLRPDPPRSQCEALEHQWSLKPHKTSSIHPYVFFWNAKLFLADYQSNK